jgi:predicted transcriptional regulator
MEPKKIRQALKEKKYSQPKIAGELGKTQTAISLVISGKSTSHDIRARIADIIKKPYNKVWGDEVIINRSEHKKLLSISRGIKYMIERMLKRRIPESESKVDNDPLKHLRKASNNIDDIMETKYFKEL